MTLPSLREGHDSRAIVSWKLIVTLLSSAVIIPHVSDAAIMTVKMRRPRLADKVQSKMEIASRATAKWADRLKRWQEPGYLAKSSPKLQAAGKSSNSVPMLNVEGNSEYTVSVTLGTNQTFNVIFDTGSADIWFNGPDCISSDGSCGYSNMTTVNFTDPLLTSQNLPFTINYGGGDVSSNVSGIIYTAEALQLGPFMAHNLSIGVTTYESGFINPSDPMNSGIFGAAFEDLSSLASFGAQTTTNFWGALVDGGVDPIFGVYLSDSSDGDEGELTLGGYDPAKVASGAVFNNFSVISSPRPSYWMATLSGSRFGVTVQTTTSGSSNLSNQSSASTTQFLSAALDARLDYFIPDTGTTQILLDRMTVETLHSHMNGLVKAYNSSVGGYPADCRLLTQGPNVTFILNNVAYMLPPTSYVMESTDDGSGTSCFSGFSFLEFAPTQPRVAIFGDLFLRRFYSLYDRSQLVFGFAPAVHAASSVQTQHQTTSVSLIQTPTFNTSVGRGIITKTAAVAVGSVASSATTSTVMTPTSPTNTQSAQSTSLSSNGYRNRIHTHLTALAFCLAFLSVLSQFL